MEKGELCKGREAEEITSPIYFVWMTDYQLKKEEEGLNRLNKLSVKKEEGSIPSLL